MALHTRLNPFSKPNNDTGFGTNANNYGGRFINKDGSFNLQKEGLPFFKRYNIYHALINMPGWKFFIVIVSFFISINILYTLIYLLLGIDGLQGYLSTNKWERIKEVFFFSTETFTTVGYGRVNPVSDGTNVVAAFEAMTGFLSFAIATGLFFGRFAKPKAFIMFSDKAVIAPYKEITGLMFRFASYKDDHFLTNVEVRVSLSLLTTENGENIYKFFDLPLERKFADNLPMNFTVVHPIDERSPIYGFTQEDLTTSDFEIYVLVKAFNDVYSATVLQRTSYTYDEVEYDVKFVPMYRESSDGKTTILEMHKLNKYVSVKKS